MLKFNEPATETTTPEPERGALPITPLEMRQTTFASGWRGYVPDAVRSFLAEASESYELALRENERLRQDIERLQGSIRQYQDLESGLKTTLVHAQKVADDVRANATQEADRLVKTVTERATLSEEVPALLEGTHTTDLSVVDAKGMAVALTTTLNDLFGSGVYLTSAGFFLNDEMDDFTSRPGVPNMYGLVQGEANAIQPGKRMLSAMSPTIVLDRRGRVLLVAGSRGGPRIITSTTQVVLNVIDYRMSLADAMSAPRLHHQALPDSLRLEEGGVTAAVSDSLRAMGYATLVGGWVGNVNALMRVPGGFEGVADPRGRGRAMGY